MNLAVGLEMVTQTHPGKIRTHNEDALYADAALGLAILADGMGGYRAGEVASGMAVSQMATNFASLIPAFEAKHEAIDDARANLHLIDEVIAANSAIHLAARNQPRCAGMGTTLVAALFYGDRMSSVHVGDSRLYRLRGEHFEQLTRDHSLIQEQIDSGLISPEEARQSNNKNLVTRALGVDPSVEPEVNSFDVQTGDVFLLCSDGLNDMVEDEDIARLLSQSDDLTRTADELVRMANDNGGWDNISVILVKVAADNSTTQGRWHKLRNWLK